MHLTSAQWSALPPDVREAFRYAAENMRAAMLMPAFSARERWNEIQAVLDVLALDLLEADVGEKTKALMDVIGRVA